MEMKDIKIWSKYNRFTVLEDLWIINKRRRLLCQCDCWNIKNILSYNVIKWVSKSCWCYLLEVQKKRLTTHWMSRTKIYKVFKSVETRCNKKNDNAYKYYWWRWIKCLWNSFEEFYKDMWNTYKEWLEIERINNNWNYCKENCKWATRKEQLRNTRRTKIYKWKCLTEWCEELWLNFSTINNRIWSWWDIEKALFTPIKKKYSNI